MKTFKSIFYFIIMIILFLIGLTLILQGFDENFILPLSISIGILALIQFILLLAIQTTYHDEFFTTLKKLEKDRQEARNKWREANDVLSAIKDLAMTKLGMTQTELDKHLEIVKRT